MGLLKTILFSVFGRSVDRQNQLDAAICAGELERFRQLLPAPLLIRLNSYLSDTLLHNVAASGTAEMVAYLLSCGARINAAAPPPRDAETPLHAAAAAGNAEVVRVLIEAGANVDALDNSKHTPLHYAAEAGHAAVVKALAERGARHSPIHVAAMLNHTAMVEAAIREGSDVNARDEHSATPLLWAVRGGDDTETAALLIQERADVNAADRAGRSPIMEAASRRHRRMYNLLMAHGAVDNLLEEALKALLRMTTVNGWAEEVDSLLANGAALTTGVEYTPLNFAAYNGFADVVQVLIDHGANINAIDEQGRTPLHEAAGQNQLRITRLLIDHGANIHATDKDGRTPLSVAINAGYDEIAQLLREHGAEQ